MSETEADLLSRLRAVGDVDDPERSLLLEAAAEIEGLKKEKQKHGPTCCAYCGKGFTVDDDASLISAHIAACPKHPLHDAGIRIAEQQAEIERLRASRDRASADASAFAVIAEQLCTRNSAQAARRLMRWILHEAVLPHACLSGDCDHVRVDECRDYLLAEYEAQNGGD